MAADDTTSDAPPAVDAESSGLIAALEAALGEGIVEHAFNHGDVVVRVRPDSWRAAAEAARSRLDCDYLSFISAIDWMPTPLVESKTEGDISSPVQPKEMTFGVAGSAGRFQMLARVSSTTKNWGVTFKTDLDETKLSVDSWVPVYPGADWHERECWEMFGVEFAGHPHIRHLFLPAEFEGNPLRKDFALLAREVKPWPGLVDVELMPGEPDDGGSASDGGEGTDG